MANQQQNAQVQPAPVQLVPVDTGTAINALVPQSFDGAMQVARWLSQSSLLPKSVNKEFDIFFIITAGMEIGIPPMAALRSLYVVNGRTALESRAKMALCLSKGAAAHFKRVEYTPDATTWETLRKGQTEPVRLRYTRQEAIDAGLAPGRPTGSRSDAHPMAGKEGPWRQYTQRMISHRALGWICDDVYPDIVLGVATAEDFDQNEFTFRPITPGVDLGTMMPAPQQQAQPDVVPGTPTTAKNANTPKEKKAEKIVEAKAEEKPTPKDEAGSFDKNPNAKALDDDDEIAEFMEKIGTFQNEAELKDWVEKNIKVRKMTDAVRNKFLNAYADQRDLIRDAAKNEKAGQ